ncbi:signal peptide peptidase SppA [Vulgatibacter sp.]|uniref:signal peptide peptidase SppA n=1 Tax=Vulgatibacter sp. TaxID=1971226 RepID=UPI003563DADF
MDKRSALVLGGIFGGVFVALFGFLFLSWTVVQGQGRASFGGGRIGVVEVKGPIMESDDAVQQLHDFLEDDGIQAVVVRVDSPGGSVAPSQEIHTEVRRLAEKKHVVVSMGGVAASGGYYLAAPADRIFANPGTLTGSIGVISQLPNVAEITDKLGFKMNVVKSGASKDVGNPFRPFTDADRAVFQSMIDKVYEQFVAAIVEGRKLPEERVRAVADGRVLTGEEAVELGLVDELGNFHDAVRAAADLAGIEGDPHLVYPPEEKVFGIESLLADGARAAVRAGVGELERQVEGAAAGPQLQYLLPGY